MRSHWDQKTFVRITLALTLLSGLAWAALLLQARRVIHTPDETLKFVAAETLAHKMDCAGKIPSEWTVPLEKLGLEFSLLSPVSPAPRRLHWPPSPHWPQAFETVAVPSSWPWGDQGALTGLPCPDNTAVLVRYQRFEQLVILQMPRFFGIVGSMLMASLMALGLAALDLSRKSSAAREVFERLGQGDLQARMPLGLFDVKTGLVSTFNHMAERIGQLVADLLRARQAQKEWMQNLGHDLRTPLADLRVQAETLQLWGQKLPPEKYEKLTSQLLQELDWVQKLMDDLFFLTQFEDPSLADNLNTEDVSLTELTQKNWPANTSIQLTFATNNIDVANGNVTLLERLVRNILGNAARYAKGRVIFSWEKQGSETLFVWKNDGPPISDEMAQKWGQRQRVRVVGSLSHEPSLGMGSQIICKVAEVHGGKAWIQPCKEGTEVRLLLPAKVGTIPVQKTSGEPSI